MNAAWEVYKQVYTRLAAHNRTLSKLDLSVVAPALHKARDLELAVPGTYQVPAQRLPNPGLNRIRASHSSCVLDSIQPWTSQSPRRLD